jgi:hypothetical protein
MRRRFAFALAIATVLAPVLGTPLTLCLKMRPTCAALSFG